MFRLSTEAEHEERSEGGTRHLFGLGHFEFHDAMDGEGRLHHFVVDLTGTDDDVTLYEADREVMYEIMARYLAGEYEKHEYDMERSPAHDALLDTLEIATARARSGETEFAFDDLEVAEDWDEVEDEEDVDDEEP